VIKRTTDRYSLTTATGKGEKVRARKCLNVRAHRGSGDRAGTANPAGSKTKQREGLVRPVTTLG